MKDQVMALNVQDGKGGVGVVKVVYTIPEDGIDVMVKWAKGKVELVRDGLRVRLERLVEEREKAPCLVLENRSRKASVACRTLRRRENL